MSADEPSIVIGPDDDSDLDVTGDWPDVSGLIDPDGSDQRTHKQRMTDGDWFWGADPRLIAEQTRTSRRYRAYLAAAESGDWEAMEAAAKLLFRAAEWVYIKPPFTIDYGYNVSFGRNTFVNSGAVFLDAAPITFGADVLVGPNCQFLTAYHPLDPDERRKQHAQAKPITVHDDAWIGAGSILMAGVTIGAATVVGAGSVVTKDVPARTIVVGNPARVVREL